jgi:hypothetical protein
MSTLASFCLPPQPLHQPQKSDFGCRAIMQGDGVVRAYHIRFEPNNPKLHRRFIEAMKRVMAATSK